MTTKKKLTPKQSLFVKEYLIDLNATQASIRAGYSKKTAKQIGTENLAKPAIAKAIAEGAGKRAERLDIDASWVLERAKLINDRCMQIEPVLDAKGQQAYCKNADGEVVPAFTFDAPGANKSLDTIGKHVDVQAFDNRIIMVTSEELKSLSTEELEKLQAEVIARSKK